MEIISVRKMLEDMEQGNIFSLQVVKYDKKSKTGGDLMVIREGFLSIPDRMGSGGAPYHTAIDTPATKSPRHWIHYTRNVKLLQNGAATGKIVKIHPPLVLIYNGKNVVT